MSLRGNPVEEKATLPDGRYVTILVGVPDDPYIAKKEIDTVDVELRIDGEVVAAINTVLDVEDDSAGRRLAGEIKSGLENGDLEPTAGAIEPLAETLR